MKRKMYVNETKNKVCFYEIDPLGYANVLLISRIPYLGYWQFTILPSEYNYAIHGDEKRLFKLLDIAEDKENWSTRGCSCTCGYNDLLDEIKMSYPDLTPQEMTTIERVMALPLIGNKIIINGKYNEKIVCNVISVDENAIIQTKDENGNKIEVCFHEILEDKLPID